MRISENTVVSFHYVLKNDKGAIIDQSNEQQGPISILQGHGNIILGIEEELQGKMKGEEFSCVVEAAKAYGEYNVDLVQIVPLSGFKGEGDEKLHVGLKVQVETNQGASVAEVTQIDGEDVTLDLNHPLSGEDLHFDITIADVREAEQDEITHGHAHGPGGHEH